jgi:hypothetical protein
MANYVLKTPMKKIGLSTIVLLMAYSAISQVYLIDENFDSVTAPALPDGWITTTNFDIGFRTENGNNSDYSNASGLNNVVIRNSDSTGTYTFYSPVFSTMDLIDVQLIWGSRVSTNFLSSGSVPPVLEYSANGGVSWSALSYTESDGGSIWGLVNGGTPILLPAETYQNPTVQLRWKVNIVSSPNGTYRMDDVKVWGTENPFVNLRLLVNMLFQPVGGEDIYTAGDFNGWDTGSAVMTNIGGSIYEYVVPVLRNSLVKFRFYNGFTIGSEIVPDSCGTDDEIGLGFARFITIGENDTVYGPVCFGECGNCVIVEPVYVNFDVWVDMSQQIVGGDGVFVIGNFGDGTTEQIVPLVMVNDNVYTANIEMLEGTNVRYRFLNGSSTAAVEVVPPACGVLNSENIYVREAFIGGEDLSTDTVCFSECAACVFQAVRELESNITLWPNPAAQSVFIQNPFPDAQGVLRLHDMDGKLCREIAAHGGLIQVDLSDVSSGIYVLTYQCGHRAHRQRLIINAGPTNQ